MAGSVGKKMNRTIMEAEKKIEKITANAIKASIVFIMVFVGVIFALVGLSQYITVAYNLSEGLGLIIIGVALILLGWFGKLIRP